MWFAYRTPLITMIVASTPSSLHAIEGDIAGQRVYARTAGAVVRVTAKGCPGERLEGAFSSETMIRRGSGFLVTTDRGTLVLTAYHVVAGCKDLTVQAADINGRVESEQSYDPRVSKVTEVICDHELDLAVLELDNTGLGLVPDPRSTGRIDVRLSLSKQRPHNQEKLWVIGINGRGSGVRHVTQVSTTVTTPVAPLRELLTDTDRDWIEDNGFPSQDLSLVQLLFPITPLGFSGSPIIRSRNGGDDVRVVGHIFAGRDTFGYGAVMMETDLQTLPTDQTEASTTCEMPNESSGDFFRSTSSKFGESLCAELTLERLETSSPATQSSLFDRLGQNDREALKSHLTKLGSTGIGHEDEQRFEVFADVQQDVSIAIPAEAFDQTGNVDFLIPEMCNLVFSEGPLTVRIGVDKTASNDETFESLEETGVDKWKRYTVTRSLGKASLYYQVEYKEKAGYVDSLLFDDGPRLKREKLLAYKFWRSAYLFARNVEGAQDRLSLDGAKLSNTQTSGRLLRQSELDVAVRPRTER